MASFGELPLLHIMGFLPPRSLTYLQRLVTAYRQAPPKLTPQAELQVRNLTPPQAELHHISLHKPMESSHCLQFRLVLVVLFL